MSDLGFFFFFFLLLRENLTIKTKRNSIEHSYLSDSTTTFSKAVDYLKKFGRHYLDACKTVSLPRYTTFSQALLQLNV